MKVRYLAQQHENLQLGPLLLEALSKEAGKPKRVVNVSAFASRGTILRFKKVLSDLSAGGTEVSVVVGVDMGGTSKEVLEELAKWPVKVFVFKNRRAGVTFHPKIYLIECATSADIFLGSNNLTDGGLYTNYEGTAHISYSLPDDSASYATAKSELTKFLDPKGPIAKQLDAAYLSKLLARKDIPTEAESSKRKRTARFGQPAIQEQDDTFGYEQTSRPAPLPIEFQKVVIAANTHQMEASRKARRKQTAKSKAPHTIISDEPVAQLTSPTAFYMELNATKGKKAEKGGKSNIPGEQRIPLEAVWSAKEFWGWPDNYIKSVNPRKGKKPKPAKPGEDRIYHNWYTVWDISQVADPNRHVRKEIRMYFYENSSDFRFTSSEIAKWGDPGDIVRITKVDDGKLTYTCELAKAGTKKHGEWKSFCVIVGKSDRGFGFA